MDQGANMKEIQLDCTPDPHIIQSLISTKIDGPEAVSEFIDNSFDANAKDVIVNYNYAEKELTIIDNGCGCSNLSVMLAMGKCQRHPTSKLGIYGVGLKNAAIGIGEFLAIETNHKGIKRCADLCWLDMNNNGWKSQSGIEDECPNTPNGTTITIRGLRKKLVPQAILDDLSFTFAPALESGRTITFNKNKIKAWKPVITGNEHVVEEMHDSLKYSFKVRYGTTARNDRDPFILSYEHRIIGETTEPVGDYNTSSKFIALVELKGEWDLLKHKDGLRDGSKASWLWSRLGIICKDLLKKLHEQGESVELEQMSSQLQSAMNIVIGKAKRAKKEEDEGTIKPQWTKRKTKEASIVDGKGNVKQRNLNISGHGFSIVYQELDISTIGKVDVNENRVCIRLNSEHEYIKQCRKTKNMIAIKTCAIFLLCNQQLADPDQSQLKMVIEKQIGANIFVGLAANILGTMIEIEKKNSPE
jgi:hypothetical protein